MFTFELAGFVVAVIVVAIAITIAIGCAVAQAHELKGTYVDVGYDQSKGIVEDEDETDDSIEGLFKAAYAAQNNAESEMDRMCDQADRMSW